MQANNPEQVCREYEDHMLLKNYSKATLNTYLSNLRLYQRWCMENNVENIYDQFSVREYLLFRVKNGAKWQTMNNIYSAMRKLFREVLMLEWNINKLPRPQKERHLPEMISKEEILRIILACKHLKHQALLVTLYATGMRAGEVSRLRMDNIDAHRLQIRVRKGKGAKDRYINIPEELLKFLRLYYRQYRPREYLFNGRTKLQPLSIGAMRWPIREAKKKLGITKKVSPHTFRHCYATHHLEGGTDLVFLQMNMGHKHLKTTARYIHLCKDRYQHIHHPIADMLPALMPGTMA